MLPVAGLAVLSHPLIRADGVATAAFAAVRGPQVIMSMRADAPAEIIGLAAHASLGLRFWITRKIRHTHPPCNGIAYP
jgi:hypothetical protein